MQAGSLMKRSAEPKLLEIAWNGYIQSKKFHCLAMGGGGGSFLPFCQLNQSCWKSHEMDTSSLKIFHCVAAGGRLFCQLNQSCWKLHEINRSSLKNFHCLATGRKGELFCQVPDKMFNDVWNTLWQSYVMWHHVSWVSHQKAGGGLFGRFEPTWGLGDWST